MPAATTKTKTLADALIAFQAELPKVSKDATNPHFKSKYTSLDALTAAAFPVLVKNGLSYISTPNVLDDGTPVLEIELLHESGESKKGRLLLPTDTNKPQAVGSAITYYRRYGLASLTGIVADEDDDGNAASAGPTQAEKRIEQARQGGPAKPASAQAAQSNQHPIKQQIIRDFVETGKLGQDQLNAFHKAGQEAGQKGDALWEYVRDRAVEATKA